jgi:hypothetical protein
VRTPYTGGVIAEPRRDVFAGGEPRGDTRGEDRAVGAGIMLTPSRHPTFPLGFQDQAQSSTQGLTALTQNVISGKAIHLIGARITPEEVKKFVFQKRVQLRSGMFLLAQLDADIDANAMAMIELKLENSKALVTRPGPWRRTWDVEYFLKALEEIYAIDVVDKSVDEPGIWRTLADSLRNIRVDSSRIEALSVEFTAVILEKDTKHKLPEANKARALKDLARVFTSSSNPHRSLDSNKAFSTELQEELAQVPGYSEDPTLKVFLRVCDGLILKWQRAHFDNLNRGGKRANSGGQVQGNEANRSKRTRVEPGAYTTGDNKHCERCGISRHKREQCQFSDHPDFNKKGLWINNSALAAKGDEVKHPKLKWSEYASGGTISNTRFPEKNRMDRSGDRSVQVDGRKADDAADRSHISGPARDSVPDEHGYKVKERGVRFDVPKDREGRGGNHHLSSLVSKSSCDCDDADIDMTHRMCCFSVGNSPS